MQTFNNFNALLLKYYCSRQPRIHYFITNPISNGWVHYFLPTYGNSKNSKMLDPTLLLCMEKWTLGVVLTLFAIFSDAHRNSTSLLK